MKSKSMVSGSLLDQQTEQEIEVPTDSIVEKETIPAAYGITRKSIRRPLIAIPYRDPKRLATQWMTVFKPQFTSRIPMIKIRLIPGVTEKTLAVVTFFRGCRNVNVWQMWQAIKRLREKGRTDEQIAAYADIKKVRIIHEYSFVEDMDPRLWDGGNTAKDKTYPTIMDVRAMRSIPKEHQLQIWKRIKHIKDVVCRTAVAKLVVKKMGIVPPHLG